MEAGKVKCSTGKRTQGRPDRRDGRRRRRQGLRRRRRGDRALGLSDLRLLLGHVHRQFDELPDRGARPLAARQRHDRSRPTPTASSSSSRPAISSSISRAATTRRTTRASLPRTIAELQGVRERDDARHRDGRLDQHRAASARRRARGRDRLHHGRHRPAVAPRAGPVQGRAVGRRRAYRGRASRRRHHGHPRRTRPRRAPQPRRPDGPRRVARACAVAQRHQARRSSNATREFFSAAPGGVPTQVAFSQSARYRIARRGPREGRDPRRRPRLLEGRRPRGALRQHRRATAAS